MSCGEPGRSVRHRERSREWRSGSGEGHRTSRRFVGRDRGVRLRARLTDCQTETISLRTGVVATSSAIQAPHRPVARVRWSGHSHGCRRILLDGNADWISTVAGANGNGAGSFTYSVQVNTTNASRNGTVTVGATSFSIAQGAGTGASSGGATSVVGSAPYCRGGVRQATGDRTATLLLGIVMLFNNPPDAWQPAPHRAGL